MTITARLDVLIEKYQKLADGKKELVRIVREAELFEEVFHSNAIENSTLTLRDTERILLEMETEKGYTAREIFEAKNLYRVYNYVLEKDPEINIENILLMHKFLIDNIDDKIAGRFRQDKEYVRVGSYYPPVPELVADLMDELLSRKIKTYIDVAHFHVDFERIHPFVDGNGRTGRVLMNWQLMKLELPPVIIRSETKFKDYYPFLAETNHYGFEKQIALYLSESINLRLAHIEVKHVVPLVDYSKIKNLNHSATLQKAHRQTIPAFRIHGKWQIGIDVEEHFSA